MPQTLMPGAILSMQSEAVDRLLQRDSGDGALLYLYLLRHGNMNGLNWPPQRINEAMEVLRGLQMAPKEIPPSPVAVPATVLPVDEPVPNYSTEEIGQVLAENASPFTLVADEVERQLGKKLNAVDLKSLYTLYDHLALPPEVILLLTTYCVEEHQRKFGAGRKPFVSALKKEGFAWARRGLETAQRAEEFLQKQSYLRSRAGEILQILDIPPRPLVTKEQGYVAEWEAMGFPNGAIRLAYEKTVMKKGSLDWTYLNGILRQWHSKGLHTLEEIEGGDRDKSLRPGQGGYRPQATSVQQDEKIRGDMERMRRMMEQMKREGD